MRESSEGHSIPKASETRRGFFTRLGVALAAIGVVAPHRANANHLPRTSMDPFIGEVVMFAGNFAPRDWALCDGNLLPISSYQALFSILGTTYGGDGRTTFGLPDLRGRVAMHPGNGPGLTGLRLGEKGGTETVTPRSLKATAAEGEAVDAASSERQSNLPPYQCVNYIIALQGVFPSRS